MWNIISSYLLFRNIDSRLRDRGWFAGLSGGVICRGYSNHDMDIIVVPFDKSNYNVDTVNQILCSLGMNRTHKSEEMIQNWRKKGLNDTKFVESYRTKTNKRVDVIYLT